MTVYKTSDIFTEDENGDFVMKIPDGILKAAGLTAGDDVKISLGDKGTLVIEKEEKT